MDAKTVNGVAIDECPKCGGRWYDMGELGKSVANPEKFAQIKDSPLFRPRAGERLCPHCNKKMTNGGLVNEFLRVDMCEGCKGFWLDKNEIALLDKLLA